MRCRHDVERNGYFTGRRCSNEATWTVTFLRWWGIESETVVMPVCGTHKAKVLRRNTTATAERRSDNLGSRG